MVRPSLSIRDPASAIFLAALMTSEVFFRGPLPLGRHEETRGALRTTCLMMRATRVIHERPRRARSHGDPSPSLQTRQLRDVTSGVHLGLKVRRHHRAADLQSRGLERTHRIQTDGPPEAQRP
ncbi:hypothetical protein EYF80_061668 [Liparis tanakae]|uniref:Uncharacterized protein n=1 Tax=Liparis tanakae TaxID=230148 RepID=A0A4Z2EHA7_9TELE|nr:hypothetical protein EYF80_061668 [Liparis tanakae]